MSQQSISDDRKGHFLAQNHYYLKRGETRDAAVKKLTPFNNGNRNPPHHVPVSIFFIPLPIDAEYEMHERRPVVEGYELIEWID